MPPTSGPAIAPERSDLRREQTEVGVRAARRAGGVFFGATAANLLILPPRELAGTAPILILLLAATVVLFGRHVLRLEADRVVVAGYTLGALALVAFLIPGVDDRAPAVLAAVTMLASMALPCAFMALGASRRLPLIASAACLPVIALSAAASWESGRAAFVAVSVIACWIVLVSAARWLASSVERADIGTERLLTAHDAERRSSESEARRRYDARLMHDTILATLTLVAHRGEGVPAETLRAQAAADLDLLRRLDDTGSLPPSAGVSGRAELPEPFAAVERRFRSLDLDVVWHVDDAIRLPEASMEALARATGECLENVRRHSGVLAADVTLARGAEEVRVAVSDAGTGFDLSAVPGGRLGLAESVIGRMEAVGGAVRVFSAPGAGTTVLLSVPR
ncbi:Signal transduction histidine kinase [Rathayibacter oskolensis]|uniref:histidine kinase n=1 Tax=Rathayibacter oskolensis TaxID=1891671 RepID=A0A1X7MUK5_9MICO|nr:ATP-binding protein [Rathayibacter oskolensis]SMH28534.1 Signal transduction histidine kinase [Rathayibacter oskolensis]